MQKTIDKIDQLIDLNTTMGRNLAANKLKEIKDEIVGMYSEEDMIEFGKFCHNNGYSINRVRTFKELFEQFKKE
jgi:hypothetical protein